MASGIIGSWSGVGSLTYTPNTAAKVAIHYYGVNTSYALRVNGIQVAQTSGILDMVFWVGAGQSAVIDNPNGGNVLVSALEG